MDEGHRWLQNYSLLFFDDCENIIVRETFVAAGRQHLRRKCLLVSDFQLVPVRMK